MNGEIVALTPPVPSPSRTIASASPRIFVESVFITGSDVTNSTRHPKELRLPDRSTEVRNESKQGKEGVIHKA